MAHRYRQSYERRQRHAEIESTIDIPLSRTGDIDERRRSQTHKRRGERCFCDFRIPQQVPRRDYAGALPAVASCGMRAETQVAVAIETDREQFIERSVAVYAA